MPPRMLLVRHGPTEWSVSGQYTSRTDLPLTEAGEQAARTLGERLRAAPWNGLADVRVRTSPKRRASETCALAGFDAERAEVWDELTEWDYGGYEGRTSAEIRRDRPGWLIWRDGVPNGEDLGHVAARADRVIAWAREDENERDALVFSHGHFLRTLAARWLGLDPRWGASFQLSAASFSVLGWAYEEPAIERWNDTAHLEGAPCG